MSNLQNAAGMVAAAGHGDDTELAHFTRGELDLLNQFRGGQPDINPSTGLPQYGWFGNLLKGLVRAGAAIGGGLVAGPAGAAAGAGIGTKLTGGSWNDALKGAALSGIGSFAMQGLGGGGWSATKPWMQGATPGTGGSASVGSMAPAQSGFNLPATGVPGLSQAGMTGSIQTPGLSALGNAPAPLSQVMGIPAPSMGSQFLSAAKSGPGIAAALGGLSQPFEQIKNQPQPTTGGPNFSVTPMEREQIPYEGDYNTYGERGMHRFYNPINPPPNFVDHVDGGVRYAEGGNVEPVGYNAGSAGLAGPVSGALQQAAAQGYMAAKKGGRASMPHQGHVSGPGGPEDDLIPAMLSNNEHVITSHEITKLGGGNDDLGQKRMYKLRREIKKKGPAVMRGIGNVKIKPRGR